MKRVKKIMFIYVAMSFNLLAEDLSIEKAIQLGLKNNKEIILKKYEIENEELTYKNTKLNNTPDIKWNGRYSKSSGDNISNSISVSKILYDGGKLKNSREKGHLELEKEKLYEKLLKENMIFKIKETYLNAVNQYNQIKLYENSIKELQREYKKNKIMYDKKTISKVELLELQNQILEKESKLINIENNYKILLENLQEIIGLNTKDQLILNFPEKDISVIIEEINLESDLKKLKDKNKELILKKMDIKVSEKEKQILKSEFMPKIDIGLSYGSNGDQLNNAFDEWQESANLSISYNIFEWGKTKNSYKQQKKDIEIKKLSKSLLEDELTLKTKELFYEIQRLTKLMIIQKNRIKISQETYTIDKVKYDKKSIDIEEFLNTENKLLENQIEYENLKSELYLRYDEYKNYIN